MYRSVVFVHGTGVRKSGYTETLKLVRGHLGERLEHVDVRGCLWGEEEGARLNLGGRSLPDYVRSGGGREMSADEQDAAFWALLQVEPGYELRGLSTQPVSPRTGPPGVHPGTEFVHRVSNYGPSSSVRDQLARTGLTVHFTPALHALANSSELKAAARTFRPPGHEHYAAAARALVAWLEHLAHLAGTPQPVKTDRETLLGRIRTDFASDIRAISPSEALTALPKALATRRMTARRGALTDRTTPAIGDILRYQARGEEIRRLIAQTVQEATGSVVTLLAHSLGGIASFDLLVQQHLPKVDQLITVGSQIPYLYEIDALRSLGVGEDLPPHFRAQWLNVHDPFDHLSYPASKVFPQHAQDLEVTSKQSMPASHSAYWRSPDFWDCVARWIQ